MYSSIVLIPLLLASYVSAHGFVHQITAGDQSSTGATPNGARRSSAIRQISTASPVVGVNNPATNCGPNAQRASEVINAKPGDELSFDWRGGDLSNWPHNTGPMITYLAECKGPCKDFDSANAQWFKIHQVGRKQNSAEWVQGDLMRGAKAKAKLPANIAPGEYLIRHEIIALHLATQRNGAEFYPSCAQIRISGNGTGRPKGDELVRFPGGYSADHPGIFVPNVFGSRDYTFPGPKIAAFVNDPASSNTGGNTGPATKGGSTSAPKTTGTSSPATNNGSASKPKQVCKVKKSSSAKVPRSTEPSEIYPRHFSRVMRRLVDSSGFERRSVPATH